MAEERLVPRDKDTEDKLNDEMISIQFLSQQQWSYHEMCRQISNWEAQRGHLGGGEKKQKKQPNPPPNKFK